MACPAAVSLKVLSGVALVSQGEVKNQHALRRSWGEKSIRKEEREADAGPYATWPDNGRGLEGGGGDSEKKEEAGWKRLRLGKESAGEK